MRHQYVIFASLIALFIVAVAAGWSRRPRFFRDGLSDESAFCVRNDPDESAV